MFSKRMYSGLAIADYFIKRALLAKEPITNMHVLKMIYFAQGFGFPELNRRIIYDDFYAWKFGPVEVHTYEAFRKYKWNVITSISGLTTNELKSIEKDKELCNFLNKFDKLRKVSTNILVEKTHEPGSPWDNTMAYSVIDVKMIENYFMD